MFRLALLICCAASLVLWSILMIQAQTDRGASVRVRGEDGSIKEYRLYKRSYALLIGNSKYSNWSNLPGVSQEIADIKAALTRQGFEVLSFDSRDKPVADRPTQNLTRDEFYRQMKLFIDEYGQDQDNRLLIYYAGHGYTALLPDGRKMGYLVMSDAPHMPPVEEPLTRSIASPQLSLFHRAAVNMDQIEYFAKSITARHVLFVFDSCFAGTVLFRGSEPPVPSYISLEAIQPVREFLTAGNEFQVVPDDGSFRDAFIRGIEGAADSSDAHNPRDGYVLGTELYDYVKKEVAKATNNRQTPVFGKIPTPQLSRGDFIFIGGGGTPPSTVVAGPTPAITPPTSNTRGAESVFWDAIQNSSDPNDFDKFLGVYPKGAFAGIAKFKREKLIAAAELARYRNPRQGMMLRRQLAADVEMELVGIPSGEFIMGAPPDQGRTSRQDSQRTVTIKLGFWMGKYEVTEKQWKAVMRSKTMRSDCDDCAAADLSWLAVKQFLQKLNERNDGFEYRLPSEAEWEYAARANTNSRFYWGNDTSNLLICYYANVYDQKANVQTDLATLVGVFGCDDGYAQVAPVGKFGANGFGLHDMIGNVSEWCEDAYSYDIKDLPSDGSPNLSKGDLNRRVQRGGSYFSGPSKHQLFSVASRSGNSLDVSFGAGFRVVAVPKAQ